MSRVSNTISSHFDTVNGNCEPKNALHRQLEKINNSKKIFKNNMQIEPKRLQARFYKLYYRFRFTDNFVTLRNWS